jgi:ketosteroid isomerase-like protein
MRKDHRGGSRCGLRRKWYGMSADRNLELVVSFVKAVNSKEWDRIRTHCEKGAAFRFSGTPEVAMSVEDMIEGWKSEAVTFPDATRDIVRGFGQDDAVCVEVQETGTHKGPLIHAGKTHSATGKKFRIRVCGIFQIHEGKILDVLIYGGQQEHLVQLGIL